MPNPLDDHGDRRHVDIRSSPRPWGGWTTLMGPNQDRAWVVFFNAQGQRITREEFLNLEDAWMAAHHESHFHEANPNAL